MTKIMQSDCKLVSLIMQEFHNCYYYYYYLCPIAKLSYGGKARLRLIPTHSFKIPCRRNKALVPEESSELHVNWNANC